MERKLSDQIVKLAAKAKAKAKACEVNQPQQPQLFTKDTGTTSAKSPKAQATKRESVQEKQNNARGLLPVRHPTPDFFLCDMFDYALKDDGASMEVPIFTLATKPDLTVWHWESKDGNRSITVTPSVQGRATQFDKDVLIYIVSQMTEALNRNRIDAKNRVVRFTAYDYLVSTNKPTGGKEYERLEIAMERLRGTSIKTNIKTGGQRVKEGFGLIERWKIIERSPDDEQMIAIEVTLSEWLFNAVQAHEVLTINRDYFRLRKPLERRLYELARKHTGHQAEWKIGLELLHEKCGSKSELKEFRRMIVMIIESDTLPDYRILLDKESNQVHFYIKNQKRLALSLLKKAAKKA
jgi:plasmid replication initiation protein